MVDNIIECLRNRGGKNDFNKRVRVFLDSVKKLRILETEDSYAEMVQKATVVAEKAVSVIEAKHCFDEDVMEEYINIYSEIMEELSKYQIIFIGDYAKAEILSQMVNTQQVHVLDYFNENVPEYCDYILVLDIDYSLPDIPSECSKVIRLDYILLKFDISPETAYYDKKLYDTLGMKKGYVTGLSYEQRGISWEEINNDLGCLAAPSQDLFVDTLSYMEVYHIVKEKYGVALQYCVLGMSFYALWYDLSLSAGASRMLCFYDRIGTLHHYDADFTANQSKDLLLCKEIFLEDFLQKYYESYHKNGIEAIEAPHIEVYNPEATYENDIQEIKKVFHKPYEDTFKENVGILKRFFKFLSFHKIKTIVYIPPFPEIFNKYTPEDMKERTLSFLNEMKEEFHFEILDASANKEFDSTCFADWCHLNTKGAERATKLLNQFMDEVWT
ncbi:MAG: hypothetical protein NC094_04505 [Bacteroidales bacterium]|nr:hypothetical protein [Lachnoclostridium sp.]MCM1383951.1 hypothetical protein [Lachnoclostridium sp.]MCM1464660.1 hypothetical protein [Bacteroidales bacterium]